MKIITDYKEIDEIHLQFIRNWMDAAMDASPDGYFTVFGRKGIDKMIADSLDYFNSLNYQLSESVLEVVKEECKGAVDDHEHYILD